MTEHTRQKFKRFKEQYPETRFWLWVVWALVMVSIAAYFSNAAISNLPYKLAMVIVAVPIAYLADVALYKFAPHQHLGTDMPKDVVAAARVQARALIFLATVIALCVAL